MTCLCLKCMYVYMDVVCEWGKKCVCVKHAVHLCACALASRVNVVREPCLSKWLQCHALENWATVGRIFMDTVSMAAEKFI